MSARFAAGPRRAGDGLTRTFLRRVAWSFVVCDLLALTACEKYVAYTATAPVRRPQSPDAVQVFGIAPPCAYHEIGLMETRTGDLRSWTMDEWVAATGTASEGHHGIEHLAVAVVLDQVCVVDAAAEASHVP